MKIRIQTKRKEKRHNNKEICSHKRSKIEVKGEKENTEKIKLQFLALDFHLILFPFSLKNFC